MYVLHCLLTTESRQKVTFCPARWVEEGYGARSSAGVNVVARGGGKGVGGEGGNP